MYSTHSFATINPEIFGNQPSFTSQSQNVVGAHSYSSSKKPHVPTGPHKKSILQMNLCLICNDAFVTGKATSKDAGLFTFFNLCNVLQVPAFQEFVTETNPICSKCSGVIDEYLKLQNQIKELMNKLAEMRKLLGKQLVDTYDATSTSMRNYQVKSKIFKIWEQKLNGGTKAKVQPTVADNASSNTAPDLEKCFTEIVSSMTNNVAESSHKQDDHEKQQATSYTILDISNSVSSAASISNEGVSAAGSVAEADNDDNDSNFSMECASPASPPTGLDDGVSDNEKEVYVKNLEAPGESSALNTNVENNVPNADVNNTLSTAGNQSAEENPKSNDDPQWIDRRKCRPVITTQRRTHPCKYCGKLFPAIFSLQMHERTHTGEKPFKCRICERGFVAKAAMQKHEMTHDKTRYEGEPQYECDLCGKKYHLERSLYTHKRDHMGIKRLRRRRRRKNPNAPPKKKAVKKDSNVSAKPKIPQNKEKQPKRSSRQKVKNVKLDEHGNPIPEEPKKLKRPKTIKRSPKPPSNRPKRQYFLPRRKPGMPKEAICQHCGKDFKEGFRLKQHMLVHSGEKPLKCPFPECPKTFASRGNLDKHMRTHDQTRFEGEPTHICDFCGKGFYILGTLYHHRRKKHLGLEKKYLKMKEKMRQPCECKICGKQLGSMYALSHHRVLHGQPKYKCEICGKPFYRAPDALDHVKSHNPTWRYKTYFRIQCSACPPEALGFQSKLAIREHWAACHADKELPSEYKKAPKRKRPPGFYTCLLCPEGNRPTYNQSGSLLKHKKSFHSGKVKKWKPRVKRGVGRTQRSIERVDEMSSSENSSNDEDFDCEKQPENLETTKTQPVRRSGRQIRGKTSNFASLLAESGVESEEDVPEMQPLTKTKRKVDCRSKQKGKKEQQTTRKSVKNGTTATSVSKLTESFIKTILGGREIRLRLCRVDTEAVGLAPTRFTRNQSVKNLKEISPQTARNEKVVFSSSIKSPTRNVAKRRGRPPRNPTLPTFINKPSLHVVVDSTAENLQTSYTEEPNLAQENLDLADSGELINPLSPDTNISIVNDDNTVYVDTGNPSSHNSATDVKDEIEDNLSDAEDLANNHECPQLVITSTSSMAPKKPNFFSSMVIHNPLSKNKAEKPIVFPTVPPTTRDPSEITHTSSSTCKKEPTPENVDTENETVLGF